MMLRSDLNTPIKDNSSWIARFFSTVPFGSKIYNQPPIVDTWADSHTEQPFSGGYNEAFVIQFWASYTLR
jgi:hypothetical protein